MTSARRQRRRDGWGGLSPPARAYLIGLLGLTVAAALPTLAEFRLTALDVVSFALLAASAAIAQYLVIPTGRNHGFPTAIVFVLAAALVLPAPLVALLGLAQHAPDLAKRRYPWFIQAFNVSNYTLNALAAWWVVDLMRLVPLPSETLAWAAPRLCAGAVFVLLNHLVLATMLRIARGHSFRASGLFSPQSLFNDFVLAGLGVVLARFWAFNPFLIPLVIAPLVLIHRSFSVLAALRDSEERFRAMFEGAAIGTGVLDIHGRIVSSNRALEDMLGSTKGDLVGKRAVDLTHHEEVEQDRELLRELLAGKRDHYTVERRFVRDDGTVVWTHVTASLVRETEHDKPQFAILMVEDMSDRKQLEEQLRHSQKMEAVGRLAGGVAHDFNNLLTVISGHSRFVLDHLGDGDHVVTKDVKGIAKAAERAAALTKQLLAFSRKQVLQPRVVDLNAVVADMEMMLQRLIGDDIAMVTEFAHELGRIKADPGQIEQVIANLVINARDAMPSGGRVTVETANVALDESFSGADRTPKAGEYVMLAVRDTGTGMDAETKARIFEPFFTTKEKGKGTGLGLATVYGIVTQSGGYLAVESEPGRGTTFALYFPRVAAELPGEKSPSGGPASVAGSETVLLVDDDDGVRTLARRSLARHGYRVLEAFDGSEALRIAKRHRGRIELLVTDVVMPEISGTELAERLSSLRPELKVLYMSGYTDEAVLHHGVSDESVAFVQKPFTEDALAQQARAVLDGDAAGEPESAAKHEVSGGARTDR